MSNVLWLPLVFGMLLSLWITFRTEEAVKSRAIIAFFALLIAFLILYVPQLMVPTVVSSLTTLGLRATDFVGYILGEGWLSQIWLSSLIVDGIISWTKHE
jgi:hypothetical protein